MWTGEAVGAVRAMIPSNDSEAPALGSKPLKYPLLFKCPLLYIKPNGWCVCRFTERHRAYLQSFQLLKAVFVKMVINNSAGK